MLFPKMSLQLCVIDVEFEFFPGLLTEMAFLMLAIHVHRQLVRREKALVAKVAPRVCGVSCVGSRCALSKDCPCKTVPRGKNVISSDEPCYTC